MSSHLQVESTSLPPSRDLSLPSSQGGSNAARIRYADKIMGNNNNENDGKSEEVA